MPSYFRFRPHDKSRVGWFGTPRARGPLERPFFGGGNRWLLLDETSRGIRSSMSCLEFKIEHLAPFSYLLAAAPCISPTFYIVRYTLSDRPHTTCPWPHCPEPMRPRWIIQFWMLWGISEQGPSRILVIFSGMGARILILRVIPHILLAQRYNQSSSLMFQYRNSALPFWWYCAFGWFAPFIRNSSVWTAAGSLTNCFSCSSGFLFLPKGPTNDELHTPATAFRWLSYPYSNIIS